MATQYVDIIGNYSGVSTSTTDAGPLIFTSQTLSQGNTFDLLATLTWVSAGGPKTSNALTGFLVLDPNDPTAGYFCLSATTENITGTLTVTGYTELFDSSTGHPKELHAVVSWAVPVAGGGHDNFSDVAKFTRL